MDRQMHYVAWFITRDREVEWDYKCLHPGEPCDLENMGVWEMFESYRGMDDHPLKDGFICTDWQGYSDDAEFSWWYATETIWRRRFSIVFRDEEEEESPQIGLDSKISQNGLSYRIPPWVAKD